MRKALVAGINYYENAQPLSGFVPDVYSVNSVMEQHSDGLQNYLMIVYVLA